MADLPLHLQGDLEGRYRIERELGRGGMATVYLARVERRTWRNTQAAEYYREFLRRVGRPTPRYRPQVEEAREALGFVPQ